MTSSPPESATIGNRRVLRLIVAVPIVCDVAGVKRIAAALRYQPQMEVALTLVIIDNVVRGERDEDILEVLEGFTVPTIYVSEPRTGIPFARNAAVREALRQEADALVFIDDDEWPAPGWLEALVRTWQRTGAHIVLGPVKCVLPTWAPRWARTSRVFDKDRQLADGDRIRTAYSYNTLLDRRAMETLGPTFDPIFRYIGSSDHDYFKRAKAAELRSVWSPDALVYEEIKSNRLSLRWVLKRGYRIGMGARVSAQHRLSQREALTRILLLVVANAGYAAINAVGTFHPNLSWVEALRRLGIVTGLALGNVLRYEEYRRASQTAPPI